MEKCDKVEVHVKNNVLAHMAAAVVVGLLIGGAIWWSTKYYVDKCCKKDDCGCGTTSNQTDNPKTTTP